MNFAPRNAEEANLFLETYRAVTGNPVVVPPALYDKLIAMGVKPDHLIKSKMLTVDGTGNNA